nr:tripartite tricarboxylate transporter substrate-binding protein [Variovorax boronicumulans]
MASHLQTARNWTASVEDAPGASCAIGNDMVTKALPDSDAVLMVHEAIVQVPPLMPNLPYNVMADLHPLAQIASTKLRCNQLSSTFNDMATARPHLKTIAGSGRDRKQATPLPGVPTFAELGYHSSSRSAGSFLYMRAKVPAAIATKFAEESNPIRRLIDVVQRIEAGHDTRRHADGRARQCGARRRGALRRHHQGREHPVGVIINGRAAAPAGRPPGGMPAQCLKARWKVLASEKPSRPAISAAPSRCAQSIPRPSRGAGRPRSRGERGDLPRAASRRRSVCGVGSSWRATWVSEGSPVASWCRSMRQMRSARLAWSRYFTCRLDGAWRKKARRLRACCTKGRSRQPAPKYQAMGASHVKDRRLEHQRCLADQPWRARRMVHAQQRNAPADHPGRGYVGSRTCATRRPARDRWAGAVPR